MAQSTLAQSVLESKPCAECGESFVPTQARQAFCLPPCKRRAMKRRQAERRAEEAARRCPRCGEVKPNNQFVRLNDSYCRPCLAEYKRTRRQDADSSFRKAELLRYARLAKDDPEFHRRVVLSRYGLTLESFAALLASQGGVCAICGTDDPQGRYDQWHIDHDQTCCPTPRGKHGCCGRCIRGLLCAACNLGLGKFRDESALLRAAADYIERFRA
jgi:hypothetical protein